MCKCAAVMNSRRKEKKKEEEGTRARARWQGKFPPWHGAQVLYKLPMPGVL